MTGKVVLAGLVDAQKAQEALIAEMSKGSDAPIPDVDECPSCGMSFIDTEPGVGLSFPMKVQCRCRTCNHAWERLDE